MLLIERRAHMGAVASKQRIPDTASRGRRHHLERYFGPLTGHHRYQPSAVRCPRYLIPYIDADRVVRIAYIASLDGDPKQGRLCHALQYQGRP